MSDDFVKQPPSFYQMSCCCTTFSEILRYSPKFSLRKVRVLLDFAISQNFWIPRSDCTLWISNFRNDFLTIFGVVVSQTDERRLDLEDEAEWADRNPFWYLAVGGSVLVAAFLLWLLL